MASKDLGDASLGGRISGRFVVDTSSVHERGALDVPNPSSNCRAVQAEALNPLHRKAFSTFRPVGRLLLGMAEYICRKT